MNRKQIMEDMLASVSTEPRNTADWPTEEDARAIVNNMFAHDEEQATAALGEAVTLLRQGKAEGGMARRIIADGVMQFTQITDPEVSEDESESETG